MAAQFHPSVEHILQYFEYEHLTSPLREVSSKFHTLAHELARACPENPELTVALRKLLESKDAVVRAHISQKD